MEDNNLRNTVRDWFAILAFLLMLLLMGGCKSSKVVSDRETKDSVVYTYMTLYRDSLRVKDSTVLIYETVQRDSVVLRVDKATGEVLSTDTWHWKDTNKNREHTSEVKNKTEKSDSVGTKAKSSVVVSKKEKPQNLAIKTHYWRTFFIGMGLGVLLSLAFRYRKKIFGLLVKYMLVFSSYLY